MTLACISRDGLFLLIPSEHNIDALLMATYTSTRLRVTRHSPVVSDRSTSHIASGPSRLPEFSQLVDVNLNDMPTSETTEQQSASRPSTPSTVTRSEKPAAVLRALLSRLPPSSPPRAQQRSPSPQDPSERESDYDMSETSHATPSIAQESLRDLFSKALRDHGDTPQKSRPRRNSLDNSEVEASPANDRTRTDRKGKRRSLSDDEVDQANCKHIFISFIDIVALTYTIEYRFCSEETCKSISNNTSASYYGISARALR